MYVCVYSLSHGRLFATPWTAACQAPLFQGDSPGKNTGCYALLQWIFSTQGLNPGLPHCRWILYCLSHQGSPNTIIIPTVQTRKLPLGTLSNLYKLSNLYRIS